MTLPPGYVDAYQEPDGAWCVEVRKPGGKRRWSLGASLEQAMERAIAAAGAGTKSEDAR